MNENIVTYEIDMILMQYELKQRYELKIFYLNIQELSMFNIYLVILQHRK